MSETFFDLATVTPDGKPYPFAAHKGKVVLVVNTATQCGLTPQFEGLEKLHKTYRDQGLVVVGFPCDQFAHQEPLTDDQMVETCRLNHGVTFPLMAKSDVNGPDTNPVFRYLKSENKGLLGEDIKWNFGKFLVSRDGKTVHRYAPTTVPADLEKDVVKLLAQ
jgi:glutathione peroxidase